MFSPKSILVPTDFSEFSDKALEVAFDMAKEHNSSIRLLHVVEVIQQCVADYCLDSAMVNDIQTKVAESATGLFQKQLAKVASRADVLVTTDLRQGIPYREILKEQETQGIDLIVIGSHGKTGILGHLGSVADKIARAAKCPVLVVKGQ
jgi:universal stress protein A